MNIQYTISNFFKRNGGTILSVLASVGVVGTAYLTAKSAVKAEKVKKEFSKNTTTIEKMKAIAPVYILPAAAGAATMLCIFGANGLNRKQQASMLAAGALVEQTYKKYKDKVDELLGKGTVEKSMAEDTPIKDQALDSDKRLFYYNYYEDQEHPEYGSYFQATVSDILRAENEVNRMFILRTRVTVNDFFRFLGLNEVEGGDDLGWSQDLGEEFYGYSWVDFEHFDTVLDDGLECTIISTPFIPTILA